MNLNLGDWRERNQMQEVERMRPISQLQVEDVKYNQNFKDFKLKTFPSSWFEWKISFI